VEGGGKVTGDIAARCIREAALNVAVNSKKHYLGSVTRWENHRGESVSVLVKVASDDVDVSAMGKANEDRVASLLTDMIPELLRRAGFLPEKVSA
jgi:hypothetical protein